VKQRCLPRHILRGIPELPLSSAAVPTHAGDVPTCKRADFPATLGLQRPWILNTVDPQHRANAVQVGPTVRSA
jgi:hypothetical protein